MGINQITTIQSQLWYYSYNTVHNSCMKSFHAMPALSNDEVTQLVHVQGFNLEALQTASSTPVAREENIVISTQTKPEECYSLQ